MLMLNKIKDFVDEIQYYEQLGYYKTADKITREMKKLAWDFNMNDMDFGPYAKTITQGASVARMMELLRNTPQCAAMLNDINNKQPIKYADPRDCRAQLTQQWQQQNPGQQIPPEIIQQISDQCMDAIENSMNAVANNNDPNFLACMEALSMIGQQDDFQTVFPNIQIPQQQNTQSQQSQVQQPRNVPQIVQ